MRVRKTFITALAAIGLAGSMLVTTAGPCRAADGPQAKEADVKKMQGALPDKAPAAAGKPRKVLVYGNAQGFVHSSIPLGQQTVVEMGKKTGAFDSVVSNDPAAFDDLAGFDAVVLVSTTGNFMLPRGPDMKKATDDEKKAWQEKEKTYKDKEKQRLQNLVDFVKGGKGLMGIHAATDAYYNQKDYGEMIGGYFNQHPWGKGIVYRIDDAGSPLTAMFPKGEDFKIDDETYRFKEPYSREMLRVLVSIDNEKSKIAKDERPDKDHAVSWVREYGKGRVFYCSHGHSEHVYWNTTMLKHYLAGIQFAIGDLSAEATPSKAKTAAAAK